MKTSICLIECNLENNRLLHVKRYFDYNQIERLPKLDVKEYTQITDLSLDEIKMWSQHAYIQNDLVQEWYLMQFSIVDYYGLYCKRNHSQIENPFIIEPDRDEIANLDESRGKLAAAVFAPF